MKKNVFLRLIPPLLALVLTMFFFSGCAGETLTIETANDVSFVPVYSYNWQDKKDADTLVFECNQRISYSIDGKEFTLNPYAFVKLYVDKDTIFFDSNSKPDVIYEKETSSSNSEGIAPSKNSISKKFYFTDGQIANVEVYYESYNASIGNISYDLPYMNVSDVTFNEASCDEIVNEDNLFFADLFFTVMWNVSNEKNSSSEDISTHYFKKPLAVNDELLDASYSDGYTWIDETHFSFFLERSEKWSNSGNKKFTYTSPVMEFFFTPKEDKSIEVSSYSFDKRLDVETSDVIENVNDNWSIKRSIACQKIKYDNGNESFVDEFTYPLYAVSFLTDDEKTHNFDLKYEFNIDTKLDTLSNTEVLNNSQAYVLVLDKRFEEVVYTTLINSNNESVVPPNDGKEPEPEPEPEIYKYGKIVDFSVTAVYDPDATFSDGKITKKCVMLRFEHGYLWGVCDYHQDFPEEYTYTTAGYTGFNSVARDDVYEPFELARAVDISEGIAWYSENNKIIAGIDVLSCKILGWENAPNGNYSAFINSYDAKYSNSRYTITLTSPNGVSKTFYSE